MNTFGNIFRLTSFGESHGKAIGGVIDGFPAGIAIDMDFIQNELARRRPGQSAITTARKEADAVEFLSGIYNLLHQYNLDQNHFLELFFFSVYFLIIRLNSL